MDFVRPCEKEMLARLSAALTLPGQSLPQVEVREWPNKPSTYSLGHPVGAVLVLYKGAGYSPRAGMGGLGVMDVEAEFEVALLLRTLREPNAPGRDEELGLGMYELLAKCRSALAGWRPAVATGVLQIKSDGFEGYEQGRWVYSLHCVLPLLVVPDELPAGVECCEADGTLKAVNWVLAGMPAEVAS
jgi:hypothetical protein